MEMVRQNRPGTDFRIRAGVYRLQSIIPKDGDSFMGEPGAVLNGAQRLAQFSRSGRLWAAAVAADTALPIVANAQRIILPASIRRISSSIQTAPARS